MKDYPFVKCLSPRRVYNQYIGEVLTVPCGKCVSCLSRRSFRYSMLCELESLNHKYCVFVTLTYSNANLPVFTLVSSGASYDIVDCTNFGVFQYDSLNSIRHGDNRGEVLGQVSCSDYSKFTRSSFIEKLCLRRSDFSVSDSFSVFPYLSRRDLQLFLKRLRFKLNKISHEKIRFFAAGEYGPEHFRPHYHLLLWFSDEKILSSLPEVVSASWLFGRVDVQVSKGKASQYVAKYLNSASKLPSIFRESFSRPFVTSSKRLGGAYFKSVLAEAYESPLSSIINQAYVSGSVSKSLTLWSACYSSAFPKCPGFASVDSSERFRRYLSYQTAKRFFPDWKECSLLEFSRRLARFFCDHYEDYFEKVDLSHDFTEYSSFLRTFYSFFPFKCDVGDERFGTYVNQIYRMLLVSRHFLESCCGDEYTPRHVFGCIERFYNELEYYNLTRFFESQSLFVESDFYNDGDEVFFYDNLVFSDYRLQDTRVFVQYYCDSHNFFDSMMKHKRQNDANKIFLD